MNYTLITGASSGIGKAMAYKFAEEGHNLIVVARRLDALNELKNDIEAKHQVKVEVIDSDLSIEENAYKLYENVKGFELTAMINNAGYGNFNFLWDVDLPHMTKMIDLNVKSLSILSTLFTKDYKNKEAQLINVASVGGYYTMATAATYVATKFYVASYTESLAQELKANNLPMKAKVLAPGPVETEFVDVANQTAANKIDPSVFGTFHSAEQMADFTYQLYKSDDVVGIVNYPEMTFSTRGAIHPAFGL
ncbi:SDR family NAD(P)-dependent oxidoreductase [Carboxylicivirga sp. RSCT41]|uniref:SDR family NAD(P)-dependent oxidoreductase n=1 Tax=Carboxylicivirga agarovorans TaxID=3417570 RepID=UPI003D33137B